MYQAPAGVSLTPAWQSPPQRLQAQPAHPVFIALPAGVSLLLTPDCLGLPEPDRSSLVPCCPHRRWGACGGHCPEDQNDPSTGQASPTLVPHLPPRTISGCS